MKVLLDECLPLDFRRHFSGHVVHTVQWAGLKGTKNGELLRAAELAGYDALITVDQGIVFQQRTTGRNLAIIVLHSRTNQIEDLMPMIKPILIVLETIRPGEVTAIPAPE